MRGKFAVLKSPNLQLSVRQITPGDQPNRTILGFITDVLC